MDRAQRRRRSGATAGLTIRDSVSRSSASTLYTPPPGRHSSVVEQLFRKSPALCAVLSRVGPDTNGHTYQLFDSEGWPSRSDGTGRSRRNRPRLPEKAHTRRGIYHGRSGPGAMMAACPNLVWRTHPARADPAHAPSARHGNPVPRLDTDPEPLRGLRRRLRPHDGPGHAPADAPVQRSVRCRWLCPRLPQRISPARCEQVRLAARPTGACQRP